MGDDGLEELITAGRRFVPGVLEFRSRLGPCGVVWLDAQDTPYRWDNSPRRVGPSGPWTGVLLEGKLLVSPVREGIL